MMAALWCGVPDAVPAADEPTLHLKADDARWPDQHEIDLCPWLPAVNHQAK